MPEKEFWVRLGKFLNHYYFPEDEAEIKFIISRKATDEKVKNKKMRFLFKNINNQARTHPEINTLNCLPGEASRFFMNVSCILEASFSGMNKSRRSQVICSVMSQA
jgi:hypothetical protein